jgi:transposase
MARDHALPLYRERNEAEKQFDQLKNELCLLPLRIQETISLRDLLFIFFVALLLRIHLLPKAREAGRLDRQSIDDILFETAKTQGPDGIGEDEERRASRGQRLLLVRGLG